MGNKPVRHSWPLGTATRALAVVALATLLAACSGQSSPAAKSTTTASPDDTPAVTVPALFTGTDDEFYETPDPLPQGEPGEIIRIMKSGSTATTETLKVMYHSRDAADTDRPATALITHPRADTPPQGWPVLATAPGTVGMDPHCGVTRTAEVAPDWGFGEDDAVRVMTDYIGLGPSDQPLHPYLSKPSEGHSVLDAVRAARAIPDVGAGDEFFSIGHSQGGHGALAAAQLAADYAPELHLVGTVALAPAAMLGKVYDGIDPIVTSVLTSMVIYGAATENPRIDVDDYVTPELAEASSVFRSGCLTEITNELVPLVIEGKMFENDPRTTDPAMSLIDIDEVAGHAVDAPLYLAGGTTDDRVVAHRVRDLFTSLCDAGQVTQFQIFDGADHGGVVTQSEPEVKAFLHDRLAGQPPVDSCGA